MAAGAVAALVGGAALARILSAAATQPSDEPVILVLHRISGEQVVVGRVVERLDGAIVFEKAIGKPRSPGQHQPVMRIRLPLGDIKAIYGSLEELYEKKESEIDARETSEHLQLARWCLSNGLRKQARAELEMVLLLDPNHGTARRMFDSMTKLSHSPGRPKRGPELKPFPLELEHRYKRWAAAQTKASITVFARDVQRTLVNLCAAADCHGPNFTRGHYRLERWGPDRRFSAAKTIANLKAVFSVLDTDDYANSLLLLNPQRSKDEPPIHPGGQIFVKDKKHLLKPLRDWVMSLKPPLPKPGQRPEEGRTSPPGDRPKKRSR